MYPSFKYACLRYFFLLETLTGSGKMPFAEEKKECSSPAYNLSIAYKPGGNHREDLLIEYADLSVCFSCVSEQDIELIRAVVIEGENPVNMAKYAVECIEITYNFVIARRKVKEKLRERRLLR